MKANIWGEDVSCCGLCKYYDSTQSACCYNNKLIEDIVILSEIHPNCPFIQPIENLNEIEHYRYSHLKEIKIEENKLIQIFKHKHLDNVFQIEIYESRDNKTIKNVWYNIQTIDNIKIHNPEHLKFILNSIL